MPELRCYTSHQVAEMLGLSLDAFYRGLPRLYERGFPRSRTQGRHRFDRRSVDAWFEADHPRHKNVPRPAGAANDDYGGTSIDVQRAVLRARYGQH